ncbi:hypothetical protein [Mucilaginibacter gotjawali]|uniref:Uncharacterized protein n=2 Tax=Mucilaginibacter gotjawali TaxID=1550579 RepID=A0A839SKQ2_9SPHI|nr:hypothetical protein [Mucilaginibacter gotjawali]MBB3057863.1 hypothetical protein [Mucilaginibacter gotjawali]BAU52365.1 hypothetical protein MgSA37_00520 [Mucilaginibacter gotjawali]
MKTASDQLPTQETGRQTDFTHEQKYPNVESAHKAFLAAAGRMLSVNNWHAYAGGASAKFTLCNNLGIEVDQMAGQGAFISIDLPGPGPDAGDGLEWVMIEKLVTEGGANTAEEYTLMTVRPMPEPGKDNTEIAHFYKDVSTSTFVVRRDGLLLSAGAHGRNETPNNERVDLHDKIRNTAIALMARVGLSGMQWQKLVNGLIEYQEAKNGKTT